ncbi:MAG: hypothetical protein NKF70_00150 [Methanobacterium sp. ERen5]|nr:MAG: hypothetical protein NKF70_00150 [Methanobacterium sp. ERen5]
MKRYISILILFSILIVAVSGCTNNTIQNKTFNNSGLTFQYPGNWSDNATITWTSGDNSQNDTIGTLGNGNVTAGILYINLTKEPLLKSYNITTLGNLATASWKTGANGNNTNVISQTSRKVNNLTIVEVIYTTPDPVTNVLYKYYYVLTGKQGQSAYILRFGAPEADFSKYYPQFQSIANSIKVE